MKYYLKKNNNDIQYFFINLDKSVDRLNCFKKSFEYLFKNNLIKRISGKCPANLNDNNIYNNINCKFNNLIYKRTIEIGELGCSISHIRCILNVLKNNYKYAVILEDDIIPINNNYNDEIKNIIENAPDDWSIINLLNSNPNMINFFKNTNKLYINKICNCKNDCLCIINYIYSTCSYIINQKYCKIFLKLYYDQNNKNFNIKNTYFLSDIFLYYYKNKLIDGFYQYKYSPFYLNYTKKSCIHNNSSIYQKKCNKDIEYINSLKKII